MDSFIVSERRYEWTPWIRLEPSFLEPQLTTKPGLYRIRRADYAGIDYIGQTGVGIRARVRMLRRITNAEMPYRPSHGSTRVVGDAAVDPVRVRGVLPPRRG